MLGEGHTALYSLLSLYCDYYAALYSSNQQGESLQEETEGDPFHQSVCHNLLGIGVLAVCPSLTLLAELIH